MIHNWKRRYCGEHKKYGLVRGAFYSIKVRELSFWERLVDWRWQDRVEVYNQHIVSSIGNNHFANICCYKNWNDFKKEWKRFRKCYK